MGLNGRVSEIFKCLFKTVQFLLILESTHSYIVGNFSFYVYDYNSNFSSRNMYVIIARDVKKKALWKANKLQNSNSCNCEYCNSGQDMLKNIEFLDQKEMVGGKEMVNTKSSGDLERQKAGITKIQLLDWILLHVLWHNLEHNVQ